MEIGLKTIIRKNSKLLFWFTLLVMLGIIFLVINIQNSVSNKKLMTNHVFTSGQFTGEIIPYKKGSNGPWFVCSYEVNNKIYTVTEPQHLCQKLGDKLFTRTFPIIYDSTNPVFAKVLIFPFEFKELNIEYPDSLKWIIEKQ